MIFNFGPAVITFNGADLGTTVGGGSISPSTRSFTDTDILGYTKDYEDMIGGSGTINFYQWNTDFEMIDDLGLTDWGELIITQPKMVITLWYAKLFFNGAVDFGRMEQAPIKVDFKFWKDPVSGKVISMQGV